MYSENICKLCIICVLLLLLLLIFMSAGKEYFQDKDLNYYDFNIIKTPKIKICFIAGTHGNEWGPSKALMELIHNGYFHNFTHKGIFIRVIPEINKFGLKYNIRYQNSISCPDINRNYGTCKGDKTSNSVINLIKNFDLIVDFHEGWGFHRINPKSLGSTLSPVNTQISQKLSQKISENLNQYILKKFGFNEKMFTILHNRSCEFRGSLACFCKNIGKNYILIEISGQNNVQPYDIRRDETFIVVKSILENI